MLKRNLLIDWLRPLFFSAAIIPVLIGISFSPKAVYAEGNRTIFPVERQSTQFPLIVTDLKLCGNSAPVIDNFRPEIKSSPVKTLLTSLSVLTYSKRSRTSLGEGAVAISNGPVTASEPVGLIYDSGPQTYFPSASLVGSEWAVRFVPLQACSLLYFTIATYDQPGIMNVHIWSDSGNGFPAQDLITPFNVSMTGNLNLQQINLAPPLNIGASPFHIGIRLTQNPPPYLVGDNDNGTGHSSYRPPGNHWFQINSNDFVIRAYVRYYGIDNTPPIISHSPLTAAFSDEPIPPIRAIITDFSGVQSATLYYSTNHGLSYLPVPMTFVADTFSASIPNQPPSTTILYYLEARDQAPLTNTGYNPIGGAQTPHSFPVYPGKQIKYDNGIADDYYVVDTVYHGNAFAVRFTPFSYPVKVTVARAFIKDSAPFTLSVYSDNQGQPATLLAGPFTLQGRSIPGWADFLIPDYQQPVIYSGDFYLVFGWQPATPTQPAVGVDLSAPDNRSLFFTSHTDWLPWNSADWLIRAAVITTTDVKTINGNSVPARPALCQNFPNPFNSETKIAYTLVESGPVTLEIFNLLGEKVRLLVNATKSAGEFVITWDGKDAHHCLLPSGIYYYRLKTSNFIQTRSMLLLK